MIEIKETHGEHISDLEFEVQFLTSDVEHLKKMEKEVSDTMRAIKDTAEVAATITGVRAFKFGLWNFYLGN